MNCFETLRGSRVLRTPDYLRKESVTVKRLGKREESSYSLKFQSGVFIHQETWAGVCFMGIELECSPVDA